MIMRAGILYGGGVEHAAPVRALASLHGPWTGTSPDRGEETGGSGRASARPRTHVARLSRKREPEKIPLISAVVSEKKRERGRDYVLSLSTTPARRLLLRPERRARFENPMLMISAFLRDYTICVSLIVQRSRHGRDTMINYSVDFT